MYKIKFLRTSLMMVSIALPISSQAIVIENDTTSNAIISGSLQIHPKLANSTESSRSARINFNTLVLEAGKSTSTVDMHGPSLSLANLQESKTLTQSGIIGFTVTVDASAAQGPGHISGPQGMFTTYVTTLNDVMSYWDSLILSCKNAGGTLTVVKK